MTFLPMKWGEYNYICIESFHGNIKLLFLVTLSAIGINIWLGFIKVILYTEEMIMIILIHAVLLSSLLILSLMGDELRKYFVELYVDLFNFKFMFTHVFTVIQTRISKIKTTVKPQIFEHWFLEHRWLFKLCFKSRPNCYTIALFELLIIQTPIIGTLELNQWSPRIIKHVVHTL